jgi:16S rRNA processing protein RimM
MTDRVCVGVVLGAHGLKGAVRLKSFTGRAADVTAYGPVEDESGRRRFRLTLVGEGKGAVMVQIEGVGDRHAAEALKGSKLFVARSALPAPGEDEFYCSDLVGLRAVGADGTEMGKVTGMFDFGGGDVIEVAGPGGTRMLPFTRAVVPVVDLSGGRLVIEPPEEVEAGPKEDAEDGRGDGE